MSEVLLAALPKALVAAQAAMKNAVKDAENPHFKKNYADLASVREAVMGPLTDNGLAVVQQPETDADGAVFVRTILIHESGETMQHDGPHVMPTKRDAQGVGSAITYLRRYNLMAVCGIAPDDDDGNAASFAPAQSGPVRQPPRKDPPANVSSIQRGDTQPVAPDNPLFLPVPMTSKNGREYRNWRAYHNLVRDAAWGAIKQPEPLSALAELEDANAKTFDEFKNSDAGNDGGYKALMDMLDKARGVAMQGPAQAAE